MAMSMRSRGASVAMNHSRSSVHPVYEDFKPMSEWKHEELEDILLYHLPGFVKEQIRIIVETRGILRVQGERRVADDKWSRIKVEIELPKECNMKQIQAKFERGILQITMPKQIITSHNKQTPKEKQSTIPEFPRTSVTKSNIPNKPQQLQEELPSKPTIPSKVAQSQVSTSIDPIPLPKDFVDLDNLRQSQESEHQGDDHKRISTNKMKKDEIEKGIQDNILNVKKKNEVHFDAVEKATTKELNRLDDHKKMTKSQLPRSLDEDIQLLMNMGVAILVILSLGAYILYSLGSLGQSSERQLLD